MLFIHTLEKECQIARNKLLGLGQTDFSLSGDVTSDKDIVVHGSEQVVSRSRLGKECVSGVADKLSLGHLVLDMRRGQVDREQDE